MHRGGRGLELLVEEGSDSYWYVLLRSLHGENLSCRSGQANVPGLMVGAFAGNRLGAIRDAKGKSVAAVFSELGGNQKAEVSSSYHYAHYSSIVLVDRFFARWL